MRENADLLKTFVVEQLGTEIGELHNDPESYGRQISKHWKILLLIHSKEIAEFYEDKKDLAETKVRLVREAQDRQLRLKANPTKDATKVVAETVEKGLKKEITPLKEDIDSKFPKMILDVRFLKVLLTNIPNSYPTRSHETAKLLKVVDLKDKQLAEAKVEASEQKALVEFKEQEIAKITDPAKRAEVIGEPRSLNKKQKEIMTDLLNLYILTN